MTLEREWLSSGLFEGGDVTFRDVRFDYIPEYRDGQTPLMLADLVYVDEEGVSQTLEAQRFSIGNGWETIDEGKGIQREDGGKGRVNNSTGLGLFLKSLLDIPEFAAYATENGLPGPTRAETFEGLQVTIESASRDFKTSEGETATQNYFVATAFEGYATAAKPKPVKKATAKKAASKAAAKPKPAPAPEPAAEEADPIVAAIEQVAAEAETYEEFVTRCYDEIAEISDSQAYMDLVDDDGDDSIWGAAVAAAGV